ncbi:MAG: ureidoglycolate lyase, partial [Reinekea forsetii]|nr:ureidoglycolate lyase [Reinekea forsetii]
MKLLRYGPPGYEKPGILDQTGRVRDLSSIVPDISGSALSQTSLKSLHGLDLESLPLVD